MQGIPQLPNLFAAIANTMAIPASSGSSGSSGSLMGGQMPSAPPLAAPSVAPIAGWTPSAPLADDAMGNPYVIRNFGRQVDREVRVSNTKLATNAFVGAAKICLLWSLHVCIASPLFSIYVTCCYSSGA